MSFDSGLTNEKRKSILALAKKSRQDILRMIQEAGTGHIGGSLSSIDIFSVLWPCKSAQEEIVVSHGHTAAAVYAVLGNLGAFNIEDVVEQFRRGGDYEGNLAQMQPYINWGGGILGQGLSVGCGFALSKKMSGDNSRVFVVMGDGEQQKGQLQEAREFAVKYRLNIVAVIDANGLQSSGEVQDVMPQFLREKYEASGWRVNETDGHDIDELFETLKDSIGPMAVIAHTVMGKGIPSIENDFRYHGALPTVIQTKDTIRLLEQTPEEIDSIKSLRLTEEMDKMSAPYLEFDSGIRIEYPANVQMDMRSAFGKALVEVGARNKNHKIVVFDCDLQTGLKLDEFKDVWPECLIECGIAEHNACTTAAAMTKKDWLVVFAGFSVFAIAECYSQQRMADINHTRLKVFCTHAGLDVGEDGKTHQSVDYLSLLSNFKHCKVMVAADANHADILTREALSDPEATFVIMGRSKIPPLLDEQDNLLYGRNYQFAYGHADWVRNGKDICIVTTGNMVFRAVNVAALLSKQGISAGVLNVSCPFSLDVFNLKKASEANMVVVYEDHNRSNGLGSMISMFFSQHRIQCPLYCKGVADYGLSASPQKNYEVQGLDELSLFKWIIEEYSEMYS